VEEMQKMEMEKRQGEMQKDRDKRAVPENGSIFIIVLWALLLLGSLALAVGAYIQPLLRVTLRIQQNTERLFIAKAGAVMTAVEMQKYATNTWQSLDEPWANDTNFFTEVQLGAGSFTRQVFSGDSAQAQFGLVDEERKININTAPADVLKNCLVLAGRLSSSKAADIAAAIIDWRDADDAETPGGAESRYYEFLTPPYRCKNGNFETMEELCLVKKVTPELFSIMLDYFTVYGRGKVNINTAGSDVLKCIVMDDNLTGKIIEFRKGADGRPGTDDDGIFRSAGQIADLLSKEKGLTAEKRQQIFNCLDVRSECFRARSLGRLTGKQGLTVIEFVVDCRKRFWYWREHQGRDIRP
jgi:general secretion pathway protein K